MPRLKLSKDKKQNYKPKTKFKLPGRASQICGPVGQKHKSNRCPGETMQNLLHLLQGEENLLGRNHTSSSIVYPENNAFLVGATDPITMSSKGRLEPGLILG